MTFYGGLKKPPIKERVKEFYPLYSAKKGNFPLWVSLLKSETIADCKVKERCDRELVPQKEELSRQMGELARQKGEVATQKEEIARQLERIDGELKVWASSHSNRFIFDFTSDLLALIDIKGTSVSVSKSYQTLLGYSEEDLRGRNIFEIAHPGDVVAAMAAFKDGIENGGKGVADVRIKRNPDAFGPDKYLLMEVKGNVIHGNESPVGAILVSRDVTENRRLKGELELTVSELQGLVEDRTKFFSIIAHDLKSPFNAILGFADMLADEYDAFSDAERKQFISNICRSSHGTFALLEQLLEWSRLQNGGFRGDTIAMNVRSSVDEAISPLLPVAQRKNVRISNNVDGWVEVLAQEQMLRRVIANLVSNAIKFVEKDKGGISISTWNAGDGTVKIAVADNGVGIPKENLPLLFKINEKALTTEGTEHEKGTGLGLPMVREMVERMGGTITVRSEIHEGTIFVVSLPAAQG